MTLYVNELELKLERTAQGIRVLSESLMRSWNKYCAPRLLWKIKVFKRSNLDIIKMFLLMQFNLLDSVFKSVYFSI